MPNIYLRMQKSRCQFFRHRDPHRKLHPHEPLVFNAYTPEFFIMRGSLTNPGALARGVNTECFSQQQWINMMHGRHPLGGGTVLRRDCTEYLTYAEALNLCGQVDYEKSVNEDFLCIKLPAEVEVIDTVRTVTPSWSLDRHGVRQLKELLDNDFKRSVVEWALATFDYCTENNRIVARGKSAMLERYLMRYGIEPTADEKDSIRRVVERWIGSSHNFFKSYSCLDMRYEDSDENSQHIDEIRWLD